MFGKALNHQQCFKDPAFGGASKKQRKREAIHGKWKFLDSCPEFEEIRTDFKECILTTLLRKAKLLASCQHFYKVLVDFSRNQRNYLMSNVDKPIDRQLF